MLSLGGFACQLECFVCVEMSNKTIKVVSNLYNLDLTGPTVPKI